MKTFGEHNIYKRKNPSGVEVYVVRIRDTREPTGLFFNGTFSSLELAKRIRDQELEKFLQERVR
jgi:hypothetical protein